MNNAKESRCHDQIGPIWPPLLNNLRPLRPHSPVSYKSDRNCDVNAGKLSAYLTATLDDATFCRKRRKEAAKKGIRACAGFLYAGVSRGFHYESPIPIFTVLSLTRTNHDLIYSTLSRSKCSCRSCSSRAIMGRHVKRVTNQI